MQWVLFFLVPLFLFFLFSPFFFFALLLFLLFLSVFSHFSLFFLFFVFFSFFFLFFSFFFLLQNMLHIMSENEKCLSYSLEMNQFTKCGEVEDVVGALTPRC